MPDQPTVADTLAERGARYGDFTVRAHIAQRIQDQLRATRGWLDLSSVHRQALTTIADKIARILSGDPNYTDNWHDIQGYAKLAEDRCESSDPFVRADSQPFASLPPMPRFCTFCATPEASLQVPLIIGSHSSICVRCVETCYAAVTKARAEAEHNHTTAGMAKLG